MTISVGVDVGGTFTDFLMLDSDTGSFATAKVPTTVNDRARGFLQGIDALGVSPADIGWLVHGTTAGTNAVLERKGARTGLITTESFGDVLELGRRTHPHAYGLSGSFTPLIERRYRREVTERMDAQGRVVKDLDEASVRAAVQDLIDAGVESLAIHFLHSYANPDHERRAAAISRQMWPNTHVIAGHELIREVREFERGSTAAIHAAIAPIVSRYITRVADHLAQSGFQNELLIMQANGGMMSSKLINDHAVHTVMSGPAGGVLAAAPIAKAAGIDRIITKRLSHGLTYMAHPVACAAALAVQQVIRDEGLAAQAAARGKYLRAALERRFGQHPNIGDIRGRGLFIGLELVKDRENKTSFAPEHSLHAVIKRTAMERGLMIYPTGGAVDGTTGDHILLAPALTVTEAELDEITGRLSLALGDALEQIA